MLAVCVVAAEFVGVGVWAAEFAPRGGRESNAPLVIDAGEYESTPTVPITVPEIMKIGRFIFMEARLPGAAKNNVHCSCGVS
jgi:hypothetical protein